MRLAVVICTCEWAEFGRSTTAKSTARVACATNLKNGWGCATREQSSDAERDCLAQRKRKAGGSPASAQGERVEWEPQAVW